MIIRCTRKAGEELIRVATGIALLGSAACMLTAVPAVAQPGPTVRGDSPSRGPGAYQHNDRASRWSDRRDEGRDRTDSYKGRDSSRDRYDGRGDDRGHGDNRGYARGGDRYSNDRYAGHGNDRGRDRGWQRGPDRGWDRGYQRGPAVYPAYAPGWAYRGYAPYAPAPRVFVAPTYYGWAVAAGNVVIVPARPAPAYAGWAYAGHR